MNQEENNSQENKKDQPVMENTDRSDIVKDPETPTNKDNSKSQKRKFSKVGITTIAVFSGILVIAIVAYFIISETWQYKDPGIVFYHEPEESLVDNHEQITEGAEKPATTSEGLPDCSQVQDQAEIDVCKTIASVAEYLADRHYSTDGQIVLDYNYRENEGSIYKPEHLIMATASIPGHHAYEIKSKYASANEYLLDNGFTEVSRTISGGMWDIPTYINYENGVVCEGETVFLCSNIEWYPSEGSDDAELLNSLAEAAMNAGWDSDKYVINATTDDIVNSEFSPYQTINVGGTNAIVSFYRVGPTSGWQIGYMTQAVMLCSSFDNIDKQKAYASIPCQTENSSDLTTIKEYYNL